MAETRNSFVHAASVRICIEPAPPLSVFYHQTQLIMWKEEHNALRATFKFADFKQAFAFMTEVAFHAEAAQHHPNWTNVYNTVEVALNTHDAGGTVTDNDRDLAKAIDSVYSKYA